MRTIELNRQIPAYDALTVNIFTPYNGTVLRDVCVKEGYIEKDYIVSDIARS